MEDTKQDGDDLPKRGGEGREGEGRKGREGEGRKGRKPSLALTPSPLPRYIFSEEFN